MAQNPVWVLVAHFDRPASVSILRFRVWARGRPRPSALSGEVLGSSFTLWPRRSRLEPDATALVDGEPSARHCFSFPEDSQDGHIIPSGRAEMPGEPGQDCSLVVLANA